MSEPKDHAVIIIYFTTLFLFLFKIKEFLPSIPNIKFLSIFDGALSKVQCLPRSHQVPLLEKLTFSPPSTTFYQTEHVTFLHKLDINNVGT